MFNFRRVSRTKRFERELIAIQPNAQRAMEFLSEAERVLRVDPRKGQLAYKEGDTEIWMLAMTEIFYEPNVLIFYEFDPYNVWLISIVRSELDHLDLDLDV